MARNRRRRPTQAWPHRTSHRGKIDPTVPKMRKSQRRTQRAKRFAFNKRLRVVWGCRRNDDIRAVIHEWARRAVIKLCQQMKVEPVPDMGADFITPAPSPRPASDYRAAFERFQAALCSTAAGEQIT